MEEGEKKPDAGTISGDPQKKIVYAVIAIAVVILAVVLIAKFGYNTDLLNPAGGQMSLVQRPVSTIVPLNTITGQQTQLAVSVKTPAFQRVTTPIPRLPSCTADQTNCNGVCVSLQSDPDNCGSCGHVCDKSFTGSVCINGACKIDCNAGYDCDNNPANGCEKPRIGDPRHCNGVSCYVASANAYAHCYNWNGCSYDLECNEIYPGDVDCSLTTGGQHVNIFSDLNNCGACGHKCSAGQICDNRQCKSA